LELVAAGECDGWDAGFDAEPDRWSDAELLPSGLLGPVVVQAGAEWVAEK